MSVSVPVTATAAAAAPISDNLVVVKRQPHHSRRKQMYDSDTSDLESNNKASSVDHQLPTTAAAAVSPHRAIATDAHSSSSNFATDRITTAASNRRVRIDVRQQQQQQQPKQQQQQPSDLDRQKSISLLADKLLIANKMRFTPNAANNLNFYPINSRHKLQKQQQEQHQQQQQQQLQLQQDHQQQQQQKCQEKSLNLPKSDHIKPLETIQPVASSPPPFASSLLVNLASLSLNLEIEYRFVDSHSYSHSLTRVPSPFKSYKQEQTKKN